MRATNLEEPAGVPNLQSNGGGEHPSPSLDQRPGHGGVSVVAIDPHRHVKNTVVRADIATSHSIEHSPTPLILDDFPPQIILTSGEIQVFELYFLKICRRASPSVLADHLDRGAGVGAEKRAIVSCNPEASM